MNQDQRRSKIYHLVGSRLPKLVVLDTRRPEGSVEKASQCFSSMLNLVNRLCEIGRQLYGIS